MNPKAHEQFLQDVDNILHYAPPAESEQRPETYCREMEIVHALAAADFSAESQVRQTLKRKLLSSKGKEPFMDPYVSRRTLLRLTLVGVILILILLTTSPLGASLAQTIVNITQTWYMGEGTTAVSVEGDFVAVPDENGETIIQPAPEGELESLPFEELIEEEPPALGTNLPFERATEMVSFKLLQPTFIPEGYVFQGATVSNAEKAQMDYLKFSDIGLIGLGQTVVGGINGDVQVTFTSDMTPVEVQVNGHDGLWIAAMDGFGMLIWEADGINYQLQLMGVGDLELALRIAESLR